MQLSESLQQTSYQDLINHYYNEFSRVLKLSKISKPIPTFEDFNLELNECKIIRLLNLVCLQPYAYINFSDVTEDDLLNFEFKKNLYLNEKCQRFLRAEMDRLMQEDVM